MMKKIYSKMIFLVLLTNVYGCDVNSAERKKPEPKPENSTGIPINASGFEIKDSGVRAAVRPVWIDNERVIYLGFDKNNFKMEVNGTTKNQIPKQALYVWDTKSNTIKVFDEEIGEEIGNVCFFNGYIRYFGVTHQKLPDGHMKKIWRLKAGPLGKETVTVRETLDTEQEKSYKEKPIAINPFSCVEHQFGDSPRLEGRRLYRLLEEHGYIVSDQDKTKPLRLLSEKTKQEIELPIIGKDISPRSYAPFNNTYLLYLSYKSTGKAWQLTPDGKVTEIIIPEGDWFGAASGLYQTKKGILVRSDKSASYKDPGPSGLYLFSNNRMEKIITGYIDEVNVSPDGCRITFEHKASHYAAANNVLEVKVNNMLPRSVKIINLCNKDK